MSVLDRVITARIDESVSDSIDLAAKDRGKTRAEYVREVLSGINPIRDGKTFYLLDYENVPDFDFSVISDNDDILFAFIGKTQVNVSYNLACTMHKMGNRAKFIKIASNTPNSLDFHIAFYLGILSEKYPRSKIRIISLDNGYNGVVEYAKSLGVDCEKDVAFRGKGESEDKVYIYEYVDDAIKVLRANAGNKPSTLTALTNLLQNTCFRSKTKEFISLVLRQMKESKYLTEKFGKLHYNI